MRITVKIKPNSKKEEIKNMGNANFIVAVKEQPIDGKANKALVKALAKYFHVPSINVNINSGHASKQKIIEILQ